MKLNLGSGTKQHLGYINIDCDAHSNPDYVLDLEKDMLPFDDNTVDEVIAHHVLEHLGDGFFHCLQELYRVCKHDAVIYVRVPHPRHDTFLIDPTHRRPIFPHTLDMFSKTRNRRDMDNGGCETPLGFIYNVDFYVDHVEYIIDDAWQLRFQSMIEQEREYAAKTFSNVIYEIAFQLKVKKYECATR